LNFMARGEPFSNPHIFSEWKQISETFDLNVWGIKSIIISTILPKDMAGSLENLLTGAIVPRIYWSVYSYKDSFRKRWLPKAMPFEEGARMLQDWQHMGGDSRLHFCFIEGENDSPADVKAMAEALNDYKIHLDVNIVRFNPPNDKSKESPFCVIQENMKVLRENLKYAKVKMIDRVGIDVRASCGTFLTAEEIDAA